MIDVTVLGDVNVDLLTSPISTYPKKDFQTLIDSIKLQIGGGAANFAFASSRLGLKTRLVGLVGNDLFGEYVKRKMKEFGINDAVKTTDKTSTGISLGIQFKDGSKNLLTYRGTNLIFSLKYFRLEELQGKAVYISGYNFLDSLKKDFEKILLYLKNKKILVCLDPDIKSGIRFSIKDFGKILKLVDILFLNIREGEMLTGKRQDKDIITSLLSFGCKFVVLKRGEKGCVVGSKKKTFKMKGFKTKPLNPTGAGDIFNAAFIFKYLKTKDLKEAGNFANAAGALAITKLDERRFSKENEVINFLKKYRK